MSSLRDNWRIVLLIVLVLGSMVTLLVPGATVATGDNATEANGSEAERGLTNLQYGIQLDGGSRIRAPIVGSTAENVDIADRNESRTIEDSLQQRFGLDSIDVRASARTNTVEVFTDNVTRAELATALREQGNDVSEDDVRDGVTQATRNEMVRVIDRKLSLSALSGANVREAQSPTGQNFIVIEATGRDIEDLRSIIDERGVVRVYTFTPNASGGYTRNQALTQADFDSIGNVQQQSENEYSVSVTVSDEAAPRFTESMQEAGFTQATRCQYNRENPQQSSGRCLLATLNSEVVFDGGVRSGLAQQFRTGEFANDPTFRMTTPTREQARDIELSLKAGAPLPAPLDFENAQTTSLQPALADQFKTNSMITGLIAVLAVSVVVYLRYGDVRVAVPMIVTALSEVVLLLGFVSVIQFPIDLSHIAGFIAVIGTGADDLIIIADEILQREGVATGRVFQSRFRKAFWVIGAAAATTIIAMSPLTVLSLGDLSGFAIITIIGVLLGVLITRPAYGDILRKLVLKDGNED
ncbi:preprotein translocase subunit SecD [Halobacteriales archaeon QS_4_62_28]|nr:MAG: preprotein translocase subunit SecD [Halobacteriales archaeon QS_4_62_28]